jgi:hypothetical protein
MQNKHVHLLFAMAAGFAGSLIALALVVATSGVWAQQGTLPNSVPQTISYQGYLTDASDQPISGTVTMDFALYNSPSSTTPLWEETQSGVNVSNGFFTVLLGSVESLGVDIFDEPERYLGVTVDTGSGPTELPRQVLSSVPYAFQAQAAVSATVALEAREALTANMALRAQEALSATRALSTTAAPWSGLTGVPSDIADGDDMGGDYANVITVAQSGGDYTSVAEALASITDASLTNPYLVYVAPGIYTETSLSLVSEGVHLKGSGQDTTFITANRSGTCATPQDLDATAATVQVEDGGRLSYLTVENTGNMNCSAAIYVANIDDNNTTNIPLKNTVLTEVFAEANGAGGTYHFGLYANNADFLIKSSTFVATGESGASGYNAAIGNYNGSAPRIWDSFLRADGTGQTSYGMFSTDAASNPVIVGSKIYGVTNAVRQETQGFTEVQHSRLRSVVNEALFTTQSGGIRVGASQIIASSFANGTGIFCLYVYSNVTELDSSCSAP